MSSDDKAVLVAHALSGDPAALTRLVALLTPVIQARVARTLLARRFRLAAGRDVRQEVEDLSQEVFLALFARGGRVLRAWEPERGLSLENFVGLVAERQVLSFLRSSRRNPWPEETAFAEDELDAETEDRGPEEITAQPRAPGPPARPPARGGEPARLATVPAPLRPGAVAAGGRGGERPLRRRRLRLEEPPAPHGPQAPGRAVRKRRAAAKGIEGWLQFMDDRMEDRWLRDLGELARQDDEADQARFDERWDRLAAGTLTAEEAAELEALAESAPDGGEAYEAFRPLGADFQARMVAAASAELAGAPPAEPQARLLPFRRAVRRVEVWLGAAAALAASLFFLLRVPALPPLPGYDADRPGFQSEYRGTEPTAAIPGSPVTLEVRPRTAVTGALEARAFLSCAGDNLRPWQPPPSLPISKTGNVILKGTLEKGIHGDCEIWILVARPGKTPGDLQAELRAGRRGNADWQAVSAPLKVRLPP